MHDVNGLSVPQRRIDGYVNATKLCKAAGKRLHHWYRLESTKEYLEALSIDTGIPIATETIPQLETLMSEMSEARIRASDKHGLIQIRKGGKPGEQGTWVHPDVAVDLAQWLSPQFRIMVNRWIREWMSGQSQPPEPQPQRLWWERLKLFEAKTKIPMGYFCVFGELGDLMRDLEFQGFVFPDGACPDISVGKCWCKYLRSQGINPDEFPDYEHHYPDHRGVVMANIYPDDLLPMFRRWLRATYIPGQFPSYVRQICTSEECNMVAMAHGYEVKPVQKKLKEQT